MFCSSCGASVTDSMKFCPSCGVAVSVAEVAPTPEAPAVAEKKGGSMWPWIIGTPIVFIILSIMFGANMSEADKRKYEQKQRAEQVCEEMMSDAAPGSERRMTRQICENMGVR